MWPGRATADIGVDTMNNFGQVENKTFVQSLIRELDQLRCQNRELQYVLMTHDLALPEDIRLADTSVLEQEIRLLKQRVQSLEEEIKSLRQSLNNKDIKRDKRIEARRNSRVMLTPIDRKGIAIKKDDSNVDKTNVHTGNLVRRRSSSHSRLPALPSKFRGCNHPRRLSSRSNRQCEPNNIKDGNQQDTKPKTGASTKTTPKSVKRLPSLPLNSTTPRQEQLNNRTEALEVRVERFVTSTTAQSALPNNSTMVHPKSLRTSVRR